MEEYIITIDTGTTNTRAILWDKNRTRIGVQKAEVGVRDTAIDGNNKKLQNAVKMCIEKLLAEGGLTYKNIKRIIASGMITSNVGLVEVPHLTAPAGLDDFAAATKPIELPEICELPIWFIPGVKNFSEAVTLQNYESMDIMRGEEVESISIIQKYNVKGSLIVVLPGSHTKIVMVNSDKKIAGCLTTITGELLASITNDTIIADAVGRKFAEEDNYDWDMVQLGYKNASKVGVSRACFSARILNQFLLKDKSKVANYILGVALQNDIVSRQNASTMQSDKNTTVVVAGKNPFRKALTDILKSENIFENVIENVEPGDVPLSALGAYIVAEKCNIL
ncbi:MAG: 2-dehydro-3-deoxygalactonokinase [Oscillospiraceae bacterium]